VLGRSTLSGRNLLLDTFEGVFTELRLPDGFNGPTRLVEALRAAWDKHYLDLYEDERADVYEAFDDVLHAFGLPEDGVGHQRYVYMAWSIALAARPTLQYYFPDDPRPDFALDSVRAWIESGIAVPVSVVETLFSDYQTGAHTDAHDAYSAFDDLLKSLDEAQAYDAVQDILDVAITADALSPHYQAKREIFNWWLVDVVPSAYDLRLASFLYTMQGVVPCRLDMHAGRTR